MDKQKKNKKITAIPKLADFIRDSFQKYCDHIDRKFNELHKILSKINKKFG